MTLVLTAPPMPGGEYLSVDSIVAVWQELNNWVHERVDAEQGRLGAFLSTHAPKWRQVGRVCFHLAENRRDEDRPFAFMATCVAGFNSNGEPRHVPLQAALSQHQGSVTGQR